MDRSLLGTRVRARASPAQAQSGGGSEGGRCPPPSLLGPGLRPAVRRRERVFVVLLSPALFVLALVTLAPFAFLLLTSLTPLNLARPATWWDFGRPLANFVELPSDGRFLNSLGVQLRLSVFTVLGQLLIGLGAALLLNRPSLL